MPQQQQTQKPVTDLEGLELMAEIGGGFLKRLADAWMHADGPNQRRLRATFGDYLDSYRGILQAQRESAARREAETVKVPAKGMRVQVFEDPITRQKLEGMSTVVECMSGSPDHGMWMLRVLFDGAHEVVVHRKITTEDILG